jgi:hypothetical protein
MSGGYAKGGVVEGSIPEQLLVRHVEGNDYREYWEPELGIWVRIIAAEDAKKFGRTALQALNTGDQEEQP